MVKTFTFLFMLFSTLLSAQQTLFRKTLSDDSINFDYQWLDASNKTIKLSFSLPKKTVNQQIHKKFVSELAQKFVFIELLKTAREIDPKHARVEVKQVAQDIKVKIVSRSSTLKHRWKIALQSKKQQAFERYLEQNHYAYFKAPFSQQAIKPDHLRYINDNSLASLPVATAIYSLLPTDSPPTEYVNLILSWVQNIPYNDLENRLDSNGAGYLPPLSVIANNQGDCDSKTALMATIIRALLPEVKMIMLFLPNHALLGIALPHPSKKDVFNVDGVDYVLMETTGPGVTQLGMLASQSAKQLATGMYSYEKIY